MKRIIAENRIFKIKLLRNILIVSLAIVTLLSLYNVFFIYPSFTELLIESIKEDAVRATRHLASVLIAEQPELTESSFNPDSLIKIEKIKEDFELMKLQSFFRVRQNSFFDGSEGCGDHKQRKIFSRNCGQRKSPHRGGAQRHRIP